MPDDSGQRVMLMNGHLPGRSADREREVRSLVKEVHEARGAVKFCT